MFCIYNKKFRIYFQNRNEIIKTGDGIISPTSGPLIKKLLLQNVSHFHQGVQNWFLRQEMKLSKQKMEWSKQEISIQGLKNDYKNKKWIYPNRKL